jgi:opacity protein-like surface antigen
MGVLRGLRYGGMLLIAIAWFGGSAYADGVTGLYLGASGGVAKIGYDNASYQNSQESSVVGIGTLDFTSASLHDRKTAWWANFGYMAWPYIGIDVSYLNFGELYNQVDGTFTSASDGTTNFVGAATRVSSKGPALGLLFRVPVTENFDLNLRLADYYARTRLTNILNSIAYDTAVRTANRSSLMAGLGVSYLLAGHWSARLDYLRVQHAGDTSTGSYNVSMVSAGATYTF